MNSTQKVFVRGLSEDLQVARALIKLAFHLREMIRRGTSLTQVSEDFIWLALRAARDDAVIHLWKVFDNARHARSLPWFIRNHSKASKAIVSRDLAKLSLTNSALSRLQRVRHQVFAHRTKGGKEETDDLLSQHNLSEKEFLDLVALAHQILVEHSGSPLTVQIAYDEDEAIDQLLDLDVYLQDTIRGRYGIEKLELELDGTFKIPRALLDPRADFRPER